jgi:hypothetical protein
MREVSRASSPELTTSRQTAADLLDYLVGARSRDACGSPTSEQVRPCYCVIVLIDKEAYLGVTKLCLLSSTK